MMNSLGILIHMPDFQAEALEGQETNIVTDYIIKVENPIQQFFKDDCNIK